MHLFSASQINKYRECSRKWAWRYIAGLPDPAGPAAALGTECDDTQLQPYLRDGRPFDLSRPSGEIVEAGRHLLPEPKACGLEVQKHFIIPSPTSSGFSFQGYLDLWLPGGGMPEIEGAVPVVADFKTTGNWKYAKTAEHLKTDVQAQLYATWAMWSTGARVIDLVWIYFATKPPRKAKRTHLRVLSDDVADQFLAINATAAEMHDVWLNVSDPCELPPNTDACESFGGCPYRANCNLSPSQIIDSKAAKYSQSKEVNVSNTTGGLGALARLRAAKAGATAPTEALGINPPESTLPPAPPVGQAVAAALVEAISSGELVNPAGLPVESLNKRKSRTKKDPLGADAMAYPIVNMTQDEATARTLRIGSLVSELVALLVGVA